jgi:hypothetical protein
MSGDRQQAKLDVGRPLDGRVGRLSPKRADCGVPDWQMVVLRSDVDVFDLAFRCRNWQTIFPQTVEMKGDGFSNFGFYFGYGCAGGYAPG